MKFFSAILFSCILLLQSAGLTFGTHYCGGHAVKSALMIGIADLDCGMERVAMGCDRHAQKGINKKACCENEFLSIQTDSNFNCDRVITIPSESGKFVQQTVTEHWYSAPVPFVDDYSKYEPPLIKSDRNTLFEVFRI